MKTKLIAIVLLLAMLVCIVPTSAAEADDDEILKVLFIGNSYSDDATDGGYFKDSTLFAMLESMLGKGNVGLGLVWSGGKTMGWHASMAKSNSDSYSFFYIDDTTNYYKNPSEKGWNYLGSQSTAYALGYTDWDVVVLQPYGNEVTAGQSSPMDGLLSEFSKVEKSTPYMLDHIAKYAPNAEAYLYMPLSAASDATLNAAEDVYKLTAKYIREIETYTGTESGLGFTKVIPTGASVQAARYTYLATLDYNGAAIKAGNITVDTDPQMGLQRDGVHLTFSIGRYIANLTAAETLVPAEKRIVGYELPEMRESAAVGKMPYDYMALARLAVDAGHASAANKGNAKYVIKKISGYNTSPISQVKANTDAIPVAGVSGATEEVVRDAFTDAFRIKFGADLKVELKSLPSSVNAGTSANLEAKVTHGYESANISFKAEFKEPRILSVATRSGGKATFGEVVYVPDGADVKVSFIPNGGYEVSSLKLDGKSVGVADEYTIENMNVDHAISVSFGIPNSFTDVVAGKWYYEGVIYAASKGYMNGTNAAKTLFSPTMKFTREQFMQLLFNMEGLGKSEYAGDTGFSDVPAGKWYSAAVKWAKESGVTSGIGNGKFGLGGEVSREQLARFLYNYSEMKGFKIDSRANLAEYSDVAKVSKWAKDSVAWAVAEGLIGSTTTGKLTLSPGTVATRAEIAKISMSYDEYRAR